MKAPARGSMQCEPTDDHIEGPYYRPGAPETADLYPRDSSGPVLWFSGRVGDPDCKALRDAVLEIWQADDLGRYDNDDPSRPPRPDYYRCRGRVLADTSGNFRFRTVFPSNYSVPGDDGWVRVKHIHFKIFAGGHQPLTTEIALLPDEHAAKDPLFNPHLVAYPEPAGSNAGTSRRLEYEVRCDFFLRRISARGYAVSRARPQGTPPRT